MDRYLSVVRPRRKRMVEDNAELSPQMERLCREALIRAVADPQRWSFQGFYMCLEEQTRLMKPNAQMIASSIEAIKNRVEKFRHGVLRLVFDVASTNIDFNAITSQKVIIDLSFLLSHGGTKDDARLLMNVVLKNTFDRAMALGLCGMIRHVVVVEEAGLLVPEVFSRKTSSETTPAEDIALVERALGEGMILVSQRPTISENVLANSGTKVIFRCPYVSRRVARFLNLSKGQQRHLEVLPRREAIVVVPNYSYSFRMRTLDSELSALPPSQPHAESPTPTRHDEQYGRSTPKDEDESLDEDHIIDDTAETVTDEDENVENNHHDEHEPPAGDIDEVVGSIEITAIPENLLCWKV